MPLTSSIFIVMISRYVRSVAVLAVLQVCCGPQLAYAQRQALRQMDHTAWTAREGAPQAISQLAQDRDGTLWIGTDSGLFNFDGLTFRPFQSPPGQAAFPSAQVYSLLLTKDGTLWVGFAQAGVARISAGRVTIFSKVESASLVLVNQLRAAPDGSIWAIANQRQLIRFGTDGRWRLEPTPSSTRIGGIFIDSANTLWLAQDKFLHRRPLAQASYSRTEVPADVVYDFAETPQGDIWIDDHDTVTGVPRMQLVSPMGMQRRILPREHVVPGAIVLTTDGSLIIASEGFGVRRLSPDDLSMSTSRAIDDVDVFTREHGLSSDALHALTVDSHGNIWIGGVRGLDRLRPARLTRHSPADETAIGWSVCASKEGDVWIGSSNGLQPVQGRERTWLTGVGDLYSLACGEDSHAWFVDRNGVWAVASRKLTALPPITGVPPYGVTRVVVTSDQTLFATVSGPVAAGGGIWRFKSGSWTKLPGALGIAGFAYVDRRDRLWIGYPWGRITLHTGTNPQEFSSGEPGLGRVTAFLDTTRGLFAAGNGLAVLRDSRFDMLTFSEASFVRGVRGIVEARNGDLWLNSATG
jgi:ligand-binding sensor domain-containing protein